MMLSDVSLTAAPRSANIFKQILVNSESGNQIKLTPTNIFSFSERKKEKFLIKNDDVASESSVIKMREF